MQFTISMNNFLSPFGYIPRSQSISNFRSAIANTNGTSSTNQSDKVGNGSSTGTGVGRRNLEAPQIKVTKGPLN